MGTGLISPKKKSEQLIEKFEPHADWNNEYGSSEKQANVKNAIKCALVAVEEIIKTSTSLPVLGERGYFGEDIELSTDYWKQVEQELKNRL